MTTVPIKPFYRPEEIALALDVSKRKVYRLIRLRKIAAVYIGDELRISRAELEKLMRLGTRGVTE